MSVAEEVRLLLVGDVAFEDANPVHAMAEITRYAKSAALAFCNCEWPLTDRGSPWPGKAGRVVRSSPPHIAAFEGFGVVSLANNHIMNYGAEGLLQTLEVLEAAGIKHCGAGRSRDEAHAPAILQVGPVRVAFLAYTSVFTPGFEATSDQPGMAVVRIETRYTVSPRLHEMPGSPMEIETLANPQDVDRLMTDIAQARTQADFVVVSWHWGVSMGYGRLVPYQVELGRAAIDAGADLVVGHHPHTVQGIEHYKGKLIAYSLGHCGFDMEHSSFAEAGLLLDVRLTEPGQPTFARPIIDALRQPRVAQTGDCSAFVERLKNQSRDLGTELREDQGGLGAHASDQAFSPADVFGMFVK